MTEKDGKRLRMALAIVSGRYKTLAYTDQWDLMGFDPYKFSYYGKPSRDELKQKAEEIIAAFILEGKEEQNEIAT